MHSIEIDWAPFASALFGGGGVIFFAKLYITRSLTRLDEVCVKLEAITQKLAVLENKTDAIRALKQIAHEHDRKLVELETRAEHYAPRPSNRFS